MVLKIRKDSLEAVWTTLCPMAIKHSRRRRRFNYLGQEYGIGTTSTFLAFMIQRTVHKTVEILLYRRRNTSQRSPRSLRIYRSNDSDLFVLHLDVLPILGRASGVQSMEQLKSRRKHFRKGTSRGWTTGLNVFTVHQVLDCHTDRSIVTRFIWGATRMLPLGQMMISLRTLVLLYCPVMPKTAAISWTMPAGSVRRSWDQSCGGRCMILPRNWIAYMPLNAIWKRFIFKSSRSLCWPILRKCSM